ncbi:hypothetical protein OG401_41400 [Kitasatospora purpeofusca]|uniref:hypothetical protein n=1 Tax=Kitasatospora purpeofusca TaxID=67352 RepID=UPI0022550A14|nr:hypothetical protein [Kitasatospora purpeofusca]MCX4690678.1 hypothetical protein [Kitasatospora purpeofusca]
MTVPVTISGNIELISEVVSEVDGGRSCRWLMAYSSTGEKCDEVSLPCFFSSPEEDIGKMEKACRSGHPVEVSGCLRIAQVGSPLILLQITQVTIPSARNRNLTASFVGGGGDEFIDTLDEDGSRRELLGSDWLYLWTDPSLLTGLNDDGQLLDDVTNIYQSDQWD